MNPLRALARPMLASTFVVGGLDSLRNPEGKTDVASDVTDELGKAVPAIEQADTTDLVRINGGVQVAAGLLLATGKLPRLSATALAATLVPTTAAGHRFWEHDDPATRANHQIHFFKNVSMLGGLVIAAMDREGKPSIAWRAGHAMEHVGLAAEHTKKEAKLARRLAKAEAKASTRGRSRREAKLRAQLAAERTRGRAKLARQKASDAVSHQADVASTKAELARRRMTPDVVDVTKGVRSLVGSGD